tara:strand:- start:3542 stop:3742 length:201 start_codon:yes stop_codon:yes gene_type:complete
MKIDLSQLITAEDKAAAAEAEAQAAAQSAARAYLTQTDWYVTRKMETGAEIPAEVSAARDAARAAL